MSLPTDPKDRKALPIFSGVFKYFPEAIVEVAKVSFVGNSQHHPGTPLHWDRSKSMDQEDALIRHLLDGGRDTDGCLHSAKAAWRALARCQLECEAERRLGSGPLAQPLPDPGPVVPLITPVVSHAPPAPEDDE